MCGIIGYVQTSGEQVSATAAASDGGVTQSTGEIVHKGLRNLEYRGYDSVGVALVGESDGLTVAKQSGAVDGLVVPDVPDATHGIGHTRWSTHGPPTDENAHPHTDCVGDVAVVHNGIVENYKELKEELADHEFTSDTDTEVIPHLIEEELAGDGDVDLLDAVRNVEDRLEGSYAICAVREDDDRIIVARRGSPLVLGRGENAVFVGSDVTAFLEHTRDVTYLEDGDVASLSPDGVEIFASGEPVEREIDTVTWEADAAEKGGYEHYMRKEIHEQPEALRQTITGRLDVDAGNVDLDVSFPPGFLADVEEIRIVACGTSYYAGRYAAQLFEELSGVRATVEIASEYEFGAGRTPDRTLVVAVTQSGETADTLGAVRRANDAGAHHVKYFATGGVSSGSGSLDRAPYTDAEVEAIMSEAHRQGVHVAAHAHGGAGARQAIDAGVDTIEHAAAFDTELVDLLAESDAQVVGTFSILHDPDGIVGGDADNPDVIARVREARGSVRESWEAILAADVPVALGTDSMHGNLADEAAHLVDYGATTETAIRAITSEAARAARVERAGTLDPGAYGDVVVVPEHPADNIEGLADPLAVVKDGQRVV
jgi:hypothetical protein